MKCRIPNMDPYPGKQPKAQLPAKRTDREKQVLVWQVLLKTHGHMIYTQEALREILAIFGYEVEA